MVPEQEQNREYVRGFNNAYLLAEHEPQLLADITRSVNPSNEYFEGFFSGKEEWELEQSKDQLNELEQLREQEQPEEQNRDIEEPKTELEELDQIREESEEQDRDLEPE
ncbi:MAG: hypothetical protein Q8R50_05210 [Sediminibacterium sp.]|nr:hypothetical protein [Sediminibacterium sp.]